MEQQSLSRSSDCKNNKLPTIYTKKYTKYTKYTKILAYM